MSTDVRGDAESQKTPPGEQPAPREAPFPGMAWIPGGTYWMGSDNHYPEEKPAHQVSVSGFWMDLHLVTNAQFARFVEATGYVTVAERPLDPKDYPGADPALLVPGSLVFHKPTQRVSLHDFSQWWAYVPGPSGCRARSTRPSTCASRTWRPMPPGPARSCPPRPSGSAPPAEAWTGRCTPGETCSHPRAG